MAGGKFKKVIIHWKDNKLKVRRQMKDKKSGVHKTHVTPVASVSVAGRRSARIAKKSKK